MFNSSWDYTAFYTTLEILKKKHWTCVEATFILGKTCPTSYSC
jgi:hypothetical protein